MTDLQNTIICITGASGGIGAACARVFAGRRADLILIARRKDRLAQLAEELKSRFNVRTLCLTVDVRQAEDIRRAFDGLQPEWQEIEVLVNNAGLSRNLAKLHEGNVEDWDEMIDTNVKGLLYVTRAVLPGMVSRNRGHVINIGSIAGKQTYPGGNVYSATKFAVAGITQSLRMDVLGTDVRVSSVDPGLVRTEFSLVRYRGDEEQAQKTYRGMTPLSAEDVADAVLYCATRPPHVNISEIVMTPRDQATVTMVHRRS